MCTARTNAGAACSKHAHAGDTLCGIHCRMRRENGAHFFQWLQVSTIARITRREARGLEVARRNEVYAQVRETVNATLVQHRNAVVANGGVDPHPPTDLGRANIEKYTSYLRRRNAPGDMAEIARLAPPVVGAVWVDPDAETETEDDEPVVRLPAGELARFARDAQNVHTAQMVKQTKEIVARILKVPVPDTYRWKTGSVKTPGEIMMECGISQSAGWQLMSQYAQPVSIYDMGVGIYGKVLDSVWQYIKGSPDKEDLCKILKQEMEDNIGMCAQGNLTRICNILAGYMEGVGSTESLAERLGRLMPGLMSVDDQKDRVRQAVQLLKDNGAPREEWEDWISPLVDDGDVAELIASV